MNKFDDLVQDRSDVGVGGRLAMKSFFITTFFLCSIGIVVSQKYKSFILFITSLFFIKTIFYMYIYEGHPMVTKQSFE